MDSDVITIIASLVAFNIPLYALAIYNARQIGKLEQCYCEVQRFMEARSGSK